MQFSVRVTGEVERKLASTINATHKPRNAIVNEALEYYLNSLNVDVVEQEIASKIQSLNAADKLDDLTDFGDYV